MCTSPNYVGYTGRTDISKTTHEIIPKFDFIGKATFQSMVDSGVPFIEVPCGQCLECRIQQSRNWADRLILESKEYSQNYFITLTYDDFHLRSNSLVPSDFVKFMKRLRKHFTGVKIKVFYCGEYGDESLRPHFHAIIFNLPLDDLTFDFRQYDNETGRLVLKHRFDNSDGLMYSPTIHKLWNYQGEISVGKVEFDSCQYVSGYVTKKYSKAAQKFYREFGLLPEYANMSKGIGKKYFTDNDEWLLFQGDMIINGRGRAHISMTPRYFDKLFIKKYGEDLFQNIRNKRISHRLNKRLVNSYLNNNKDVNNLFRCYRSNKKQLLRNKI